MKRVVPAVFALTALVLASPALADRTAANLKGFASVCVNGGFTERGKEDEKVRADLISRLADALEKGGIKVEDAPCQAKGTSAGRQLNVYFTFETTDSGSVYSADLEGWLSREGTLESVTVWDTGFFGDLSGSGALKAADLLDELAANFLEDWRGTHGK